MVSMTNPGYQQDEQQPYVQVAQQHSMAQPGLYQQLENYSFQQTPLELSQHSYSQVADLQEQQCFDNGSVPDILQTHSDDEREQARKEIVDRIEEFNKRFGNDLPSNQPKTPPGRAVLPTPPTTIQKPVRTSLDVAPMPVFTDAPAYAFPATTADATISLTVPSSDNGYQSSYQSSACDPMSPTRSSAIHQSPPMPPLFEEVTISTDSQASFPEHSTLLESSSQTALDLGICFSSSHAPLSPRSALVQNPDLNASIEETGIKPEEVQAFISEQDPIDGKWTCLYEDCGKKFGRRENIKSHVQTHLGDRQFKCNECQKCFVRQHDLKRHAKIHTGHKPHICLCGNGFARHDALTRHRQRGVCIGALPGCFKRDVKRGRPKKQRPEMQQRVDKANRARKLDSFAETDMGYHSSSSSGSDGSQISDVMTPPDSNIFDSTHYIDMQGLDEDYAILPTPVEDTPPTSPFGSSPAKSNETYDITSTSNGFESLSMTAEAISPAMLTTSSPFSQPASSSPPQIQAHSSDLSNNGHSSPAHAPAGELPSDESSATNTPSPNFDEDFENTMREFTKDTNFNDGMLFNTDNMGFGSEFNAEAALEANLNDWLRNVS
ncbi:MAG: hypothetical protein Q9165_003235 [Trypethelium subeluteriae]